MFKIKSLTILLVVTLTIAVVGPLYNVFFIFPVFTKFITTVTEDEAIRVATHLTSMLFPEKDNLTKDSIQPQTSAHIEQSLREFGLVKIKIFSPWGEIIYSTDSKDIGKINKKSYFHEVVARGSVYTKVVRKDSRSLEGKVMTADVVETYVPIMNGMMFMGAFELYYDITARKEQLDNLISRVTTILLAVSFGLLIMVIISSFKASKIIEVEKALKESEEQFRSVTQTANDAIVSADSDGNIISWNKGAQSIFGYDEEEVLGKPLTILIPERYVNAHKEGLERLRSTDQPHLEGKVIELSARRKDGSEFPVDISFASWSVEKGRFFSGIIRDITERVRTEEELQKAKEEAETANRAKSEFLATMSHEIRTPMNAIIGTADMLWETHLTEEQKQYTEILRRGGGTLLELINDILDISKVEAGEFELEHIDFDLRELIENISEVMAITAHNKGLELAFQIKQDVPTHLVGDPARLRQAIVNVVGNSIKFTEEGEVVLRVENEPGSEEVGSLLFSVSDTGIGIPAERLDSIFSSFTQADSTTTRKYGGSGLGLTITQKLVEMMGGRIWVESEVSRGSTFYFTVRLGILTAPKPRKPLPPVDFEGLKILIVDDNATNRLIMRETLSAQGCEVTEAANGTDGIEKIKQAVEAGTPYQLMLLDSRMPLMDGFQVAENIKKDSGIVDMTIMMITSDNRRGDISRARELGLASYLVKPVRQSQLLEAITTAVSRTRAFSEEAKQEDRLAAPVEQRPLRILLVEDAEDNRLLIQFYLKDAGHRIDIAENGEEAVEKFKPEDYDIVLMDMQMPVMDGYTATGIIRAWESERNLKATPIIALTAHAFREAVQKSLDAGCTAHITKPLKKKTLMDVIYEHTKDLEPMAAEGDSMPGEKISVKVDIELKDLIPGFLDNKRKDIESIRAALEQNDYETIRVLGHSMKGSGGGYGFDYISEIGQSLEEAAKEENSETIERSLDELSTYLQRLEVVYE